MTNSPLSQPHDQSSPDWIERIRRWIFRGYPHGVPSQEALPLLQVLKPHFSEADITTVVRTIIHDHRHLIESHDKTNSVAANTTEPLLMIPEEDIEAYVRMVLHQEPDESVVRRVLARLIDADDVISDATDKPPR